MIAFTVQFVNQMHKVAKATERATFRNLGHAAARIRKDAIESIEPSEEPSEPGKPPHTRQRVSRKGKPLKGHLQRAIVYAQDKTAETATIGPRESIVGESASAHEHGGFYKGADFPARPFMSPALERNLDQFARDWAGSIGE